MALETNTLVNGTWITQTLGVDDVLRYHNQQDKAAAPWAPDVEKPPVLGLLTQTIIQSPLTHWILPVRLRASTFYDVAFIGDNFVQIRELRFGGLLGDVKRIENLGARIRNAKVVGTLKPDEKGCHNYRDGILGNQIDGEDNDSDVEMGDGEEAMGARSKANAVLPPQCLILQLDNGISVFLMLCLSSNGEWEFVSNQYRSDSAKEFELGTHLAVDPSSRYIAIGSPENLFAIYSLHPRDELQRQYSDSSSLQYVQAEKLCHIQGVILKVEFLYPAPDDDSHIILLVLVVRKGKTRMLLYEWQTGEMLKTIRPHSRKGYLLEESHQLPLLVIPLTMQSSFILVSENSMATCSGILLGSPKIVDFNTAFDEPTSHFHGSGKPLWVAWTRPIRRKEHTAEHDDIYIVREDGRVKNLEIVSEDDLIAADNNIGVLDCSCGPALASLDYDGYTNISGDVVLHPSGKGQPTNSSQDPSTQITNFDLVITRGDSCAGGAYLIKARHGPKFHQVIQNWTPALDMVTTSPLHGRELETQSGKHHQNSPFPKPDEIYACAGKGVKGEIIEFRHGFEGNIGLEMEFHTPIMDAWVLTSENDQVDDGGSTFLLSLGDCSALLYLSGDAEAIHEVDQNSTAFDLRYRTITVSGHADRRLQVTEKSIIFIDGSHVHVQEDNDLLGVYSPGSIDHENGLIGYGTRIAAAVIYQGFVVFTILLRDKTFLRIQNPTTTNVTGIDSIPKLEVDTHSRTLGQFSDRVTSLAVCSLRNELYAIVAEWTGDKTRLTFQPFDGTKSRQSLISNVVGNDKQVLEEVVSIAVSSYSIGVLVLVCGTRDGFVIMLQIDENSLEVMEVRCDRIGATPAIIERYEHLDKSELFFANSDAKLYGFTTFETTRYFSSDSHTIRERTLNRVWLTDAKDPTRPQPKVNSVKRLPVGTSAGSGVLLVDGSRLIVSGIDTQEKQVPRHIPINGTPSRLLYSNTLDCLVVGAIVNGKSSILFIDPQTGSDLSQPFDKSKNSEILWVSGLGKENERIFRLLEWSYVKEGKTWSFIIVCTSAGRFIMISAEKEVPSQFSREESSDAENRDPGEKPRPRIRYWTRFRWKCAHPIHSAIGFADGLLYCSGKTLRCDTLDLVEKRFKPLAQYELPSPAINLAYKDGKIYALTSIHSLEILKLVTKTGSRGNNLAKIVRTHSDQVTRNSIDSTFIGQYAQYPLHLVSNRECSVVGLWATHNTMADTLEEVFEAELPCSITRFRTGNSRPIWDPTWSPTKLDHNGKHVPKAIHGSADYPEILGLSVEGSLCHFTILDFATWNFLRFLINLALQSPDIFEFASYKPGFTKLRPVTEPKIMMHINGDILRRFLQDRCLEELLCVKEETEEAAKRQDLFSELLCAVHEGEVDRSNPMRTLIDRAYDDLAYLLRPVL